MLNPTCFTLQLSSLHPPLPCTNFWWKQTKLSPFPCHRHRKLIRIPQLTLCCSFGREIINLTWVCLYCCWTQCVVLIEEGNYQKYNILIWAPPCQQEWNICNQIIWGFGVADKLGNDFKFSFWSELNQASISAYQVPTKTNNSTKIITREKTFEPNPYSNRHSKHVVWAHSGHSDCNHLRIALDDTKSIRLDYIY